MSELGNLLELIHDAHASLRTLVAEYRDWMHVPMSLELSVEGSALGGNRLRWRGGGPFSGATATTRRIWLQRPDCLRVEVHGNDRLLRLGVLNQTHWWLWDRDTGTVTSEEREKSDRAWVPPPLLDPPLLNPSRFLAHLRFQPAGRGEYDGRAVIRAKARLRDGVPALPPLSYQFEFDANHGTVLRRSVRDGTQLLSVTEALSVVYEPKVAPERFEFTPPGVV